MHKTTLCMPVHRSHDHVDWMYAYCEQWAKEMFMIVSDNVWFVYIMHVLLVQEMPYHAMLAEMIASFPGSRVIVQGRRKKSLVYIAMHAHAQTKPAHWRCKWWNEQQYMNPREILQSPQIHSPHSYISQVCDLQGMAALDSNYSCWNQVQALKHVVSVFTCSVVACYCSLCLILESCRWMSA